MNAFELGVVFGVMAIWILLLVWSAVWGLVSGYRNRARWRLPAEPSVPRNEAPQEEGWGWRCYGCHNWFVGNVRLLDSGQYCDTCYDEKVAQL